MINLSLGAPVLQPYRDDPVCEAVERAVAAGIVVVAAAGNFGDDERQGKLVWGGITSPGNDPSAITVGAVDTHGTAKRSDDTRGALQLARADAVRPGAASRTWWRRGAGVVSAEAAGSCRGAGASRAARRRGGR